MIIDCNRQAVVLAPQLKCRPDSAPMDKSVYFCFSGCAYTHVPIVYTCVYSTVWTHLAEITVCV